ncbi:hypothetical protein [Paenibacillus sp. Y412MC10]|uniref:hypothetical protein n=1 Tax=Geobacillus sp. (strain Y412MC10) TaxID=481743 RepID=UPI0021B256A0|nr:hypothetical protein [Paenibacillus sp. Y412MC10]
MDAAPHPDRLYDPHSRSGGVDFPLGRRAACQLEAGIREESGVDVTAYKNPVNPLYKRHLMRYTEQQYQHQADEELPTLRRSRQGDSIYTRSAVPLS